MGKDVMIACDFSNAKTTFEFLDMFTLRKPFVKIGMELFYAEGPSIVREIKEETGLNAVKYRYMSSRYHEPRNVLMLGFIVMVSEGEIQLNTDELEEACWCSFDEALERISHDSTAEFFLKSAIAELKKNKL